MPSLRLLSVTRFWRCYVLLIIASMLSLFLVYVSQNDPSLKVYFQYFQPYQFSKDDMVKLMEPNKLDYEFVNIDPRACYRHQQANAAHRKLKRQSNGSSNLEGDVFGKVTSQDDIDEDYRLLNENSGDRKEPADDAAPRLKVLLLSIGKSTNYKSRLAARQTWYKFMNKQDVKLMFVVGNAAYKETKPSSSLLRTFVGSESKVLSKNAKELKKQEELIEAARLEKEMRDYGDIIQVNMPDDDDSASTKTLFAIRWAITYCEVAQNLFILSESSVLNHQLFERLVVNGVLSPSVGGGEKTIQLSENARLTLQPDMLNDSSIVGVCDRTDEKFAVALREFIMELYKNKKKSSYRAEPRAPREDPTSGEPVTMSDSGNKRLFGVRKTRQAAPVSTAKKPEPATSSSSESSAPREKYRGQYCSNLGWMITLNGAKKLWSTALRTSYMMNRSPAYLSGYLAFKAGLHHVSLFDYHEDVPEKLNCHKLLESEPRHLICAENFTIDGRYTNYMASWNSIAQSQFNLAKL